MGPDDKKVTLKWYGSVPLPEEIFYDINNHLEKRNYTMSDRGEFSLNIDVRKADKRNTNSLGFKRDYLKIIWTYK